MQPSEVQEIISGYANPENATAHGVHVAGEKYFVIKADERSIYGKKVIKCKIKRKRKGYSLDFSINKGC